MKSLLTMGSMGRAELNTLVREASELRDIIDSGSPTPKTLTGSVVANIFFEPSTRTRLSFDLAAQRLGAAVVTFNPATSSTIKGESLRDTVETVAAIGADILVVRHHESGVPALAAEWTGLPVVNAGDGTSEHPTQALLDVITIWRQFGTFEGLQLAIVGDVKHSRVAGSLLHALPTLGVEPRLVGPAEFVGANPGFPAFHDLAEGLAGVDIVYCLRAQTERGAEIPERYVEEFRMDAARMSELSERAVLMHPGPMNRGVEVSDELADSPRSLAREQVRNGVPARMAVLSALGGSPR